MRSYDDFLGVAKQAIQNRPAQAMADLGLRDLVADGADDEAQAAAFALLEAEGYADASTAALAHVALADPVIARALADRVEHHALVVSVGSWAHLSLRALTAEVILDVPGTGLVLAPASALGGDRERFTYVCQPDLADARILLDEEQLAPLRSAIEARLRLGSAALILGTATRLLDDALAHVKVRTQFGRPLAEFAPVRDMLAWASAERHQLHELFHAALVDGPIATPDAGLATLVKALAGTSGQRIAQATLQATGAIGFTEEHAHSWRHQRILALDQIAGSTGEITARLGAELRATGRLPSMGSLERLAASVELAPLG